MYFYIISLYLFNSFWVFSCTLNSSCSYFTSWWWTWGAKFTHYWQESVKSQYCEVPQVLQTLLWQFCFCMPEILIPQRLHVLISFRIFFENGCHNLHIIWYTYTVTLYSVTNSETPTMLQQKQEEYKLVKSWKILEMMWP